MTVKGKRAYIPPEAEGIIITRALEYPRLKRTPLAEKLQKELQSKKYDVPEIEVLERKISKYRQRVTADPQDKPWSTATLDNYPIPPEALSSVLQAWVYTQEKMDGMFTIRHAKWVSRLYAAIKDIRELTRLASSYATSELIGEISKKTTFNSSPLDLQLYALTKVELRGSSVKFASQQELVGVRVIGQKVRPYSTAPEKFVVCGLGENPSPSKSQLPERAW